MSFLIPFALWALPAAALPLIIHLVSQANTKVVNFSTLQFLRQMEHESIRRLRWHQWIVILLRTLLLLVLVLLLARPVVRGYFQGWTGENASTFSVLIIDDSFSMSGDAPSTVAGEAIGNTWRPRAVLESLHEILTDQSDQERVVIMRTSDARTIYNGSVAELPEVDELASLCEAGYHQDNLAAVLDTIRTSTFQNTASLYANREIFLLSDFQANQQWALRQFSSDTSIWNDWHFILVPIPPLENNIALIRAEVETDIPLVGELMDIAVTVINNGREPRSNVPVQAVLNDVRSGQLVVDLNPGEQKTVRFQVSPTEPGHQQGYAEIDRDERLGDNRFYFHTHIPPQVRILLIEMQELNPSFAEMILSSLAAETPYIQLRTMPATDLNWSPQEVEVVVLNNVSVVSRLLMRQLNEFLTNDGTLIVVPGPGSDNGQALRSIQDELGLPAVNPTPQVLDSPLLLSSRLLETSFIGKIFEHEAELDELPQISQFYPIQPQGDDEVVLWITDNMPLLTRGSHDNGTIFLFSLPFHLQWSDLPLKGSFVPLWHHLVFWQTIEPALTDLRVGDTPILTVKSHQATQPVTLIAPDEIASLFIPDIRTRSVTLGHLNRPGIYKLAAQEQSQTGSLVTDTEEIQFRVNISDEELISGTLERSELMSFFDPSRTYFLAEGDQLEELVSQARFGRELWRPLLYLLVVLLALEMIIGNVYHSPRKPRRDSRSKEQSPRGWRDPEAETDQL